MLDRKPGLRPDVVCSLDPVLRAAYFETREDSTIEDESHKEAQQPLRYAERLEALHIAHLVSYERQTLWQGHGKDSHSPCISSVKITCGQRCQCWKDKRRNLWNAEHVSDPRSHLKPQRPQLPHVIATLYRGIPCDM